MRVHRPWHRLPADVRRVGGQAVVVAFSIFLTACEAPSPATGGGGQVDAQRQPGGGATGGFSPTSTSTISADWDDTEAAVWTGVEAIEAFPLETQLVSPTQRRYHLRLATGEAGILDISRDLPPPDSPSAAAREGPVNLSLRCSIGLAGDPAREQRLIDAVTRRLSQLRGVGAAPAR